MASNNGQIDIPGGADIVVRQQQVRNLSSVTVTRVVCLPQRKLIRAFVREMPQPLTIYEGAAYDDLNGTISMEDVETRVKEELGVGSSSSA